MKRKLFAGLLLAFVLPAVALAQTPHEAVYDSLTAPAVGQQDTVDIVQAIIGGFGSRVAIGPYRDVTQGIRQYLADKAVNRPDALLRLQSSLGRTPNPARACKIATIAVMVLPLINSFQPIPDYAEVLAMLKVAQAAACGTPIPPLPTKAPCPCGKPAQIPTRAVKRDATSNWVSPQFILDGCAGSNGGCNGDDNTTVLAAAKNMGILLESDYGPYQGSYQGCHAISGTGVSLYTLSDWGYADPNSNGVGDVNLIKAAILKYNGVGCAVAADDAFMNYSGGVFSGRAQDINHDVFLAGWDDSKGAWLMVNSWGSGWGVDPATGKGSAKPAQGKPTGLVLPPLQVRQAKHALYRQRNMRAIADLAKVAETLPAAYSCIAAQPPIADQASCGSCWDFSGCRVVSAANILAGTLPKSAPMTGGCMWIKYGANQIGTEPVYGIGGAPVPYVAPPINPPTPDTPTRRTSVLFERATREFKTNPAKVLKAIDAAEQVLAN